MAGNRKVMVRMTPADVERAIPETDWARIDTMDDAEITRQVADDPDVAPLLSEARLTAERVHFVRRRLKLTQAGFAGRFAIPLGTLRDWEQGRRQPDAPALALLRIIERDPEAAARALAG